MPAPHGLKTIEEYLNDPHKEEHLFCNLSPAIVERLSTIAALSTYPKGATLFMEAEAPRGVFILCSGKVKLTTSSADGKTLILRITEMGEVLGLAATVSGKPYHATAEILEPTQANFVRRNDFLQFLRENGEVASRVVRQLSDTYYHALEELRTIGLSHSVGERLARFILDWCDEHGQRNDEVRAELTLTHEEIAQMIGASRETVTRLFADFKRKHLLEVMGSTVVVRNRSGLEEILTDQPRIVASPPTSAT